MNWINLCTSSMVIEGSNATTEGFYGRNYPTFRHYQLKFTNCPTIFFNYFLSNYLCPTIYVQLFMSNYFCPTIFFKKICVDKP